MTNGSTTGQVECNSTIWQHCGKAYTSSACGKSQDGLVGFWREYNTRMFGHGDDSDGTILFAVCICNECRYAVGLAGTWHVEAGETWRVEAYAPAHDSLGDGIWRP